jgi:hypothetical protein
MPVRRRLAKRRMDLSETAWHWLTDGPRPAKNEPGDTEWVILDRLDLRNMVTGFTGRELWEASREEVLAIWTEEHPGTRPSLWWRLDAPRCPLGTWPGCYWDGELPEPRRRLGGIGTPAHDALNYVPSFSKGLPVRWLTEFDVKYGNGRARGEDGEPIGAGHKPGSFPYHAIDPNDPPRYESEAGYLRRHRLLLPAEQRRLTAADFEPVTIALPPAVEI